MERRASRKHEPAATLLDPLPNDAHRRYNDDLDVLSTYNTNRQTTHFLGRGVKQETIDEE